MTPTEIDKLAHYWAVGFARKAGVMHIADELAQEAAIGILKARERYKPELASFRTYAYFWAKAQMRRHTDAFAGPVRGQDRMTGGVSFATQADEYEPGTHVDTRTESGNQQEYAQLREAFEQADDRTVAMVQRRMEGAMLREIGDEFGVSHECVRQQLVKFSGDL